MTIPNDDKELRRLLAEELDIKLAPIIEKLNDHLAYHTTFTTRVWDSGTFFFKAAVVGVAIWLLGIYKTGKG